MGVQRGQAPRRCFLALALCLLAGCLERPDLPAAGGEGEAPPQVLGRMGGQRNLAREPRGLSILTWNVAWLGDPQRGPADEERQLRGVLEVLHEHSADLIALQEVSSLPSQQRLLLELSDYAAAFTAHEWPQQMALLYRVDRFELVGSGQLAHVPHAGRPPLAVDLAERDGRRLHVIVVHAKARATMEAWQGRSQLARALVDHVDGRPAHESVVVVGDFNDRLEGSIVPGRSSPYAELRTRLAAPTAELDRPGAEPSGVWGAVIDHVLLAPSLATALEPWSADVLQRELLARDPLFSTAVSDHFPVAVRSRLSDAAAD